MTPQPTTVVPLGPRARAAVLAAAFLGLLFDGVELGLMPVASLSVSRDLLGADYTATLGGDWFARFTAALMLGAALGGIVLGHLGDVVGRVRALGFSILLYSAFAGLGALVRSQEQMLVLRFLVGLGVGGVWPNAVALAAECWPDKSRPIVAGLMGAALKRGILLLSQIARVWPITPDSWRWIFGLAAAPAVLGLLVLVGLPESPQWLASRSKERTPAGPTRELLRPPLLRTTLLGIVLGSIPLLGAWAASKWMIPWADAVGGTASAGYKGVTQGWWALGAVLGSFFGAQIAAWLGRRRAYAAISLGATALTLAMFLGSAPLQTSFLPIVFAQGFVATLFFGWLPLYLPELFPTRVRATAQGVAFNTGRILAAVAALQMGSLMRLFDGSYAQAGAIITLVYVIGLFTIWLAPETRGRPLPE